MMAQDFGESFRRHAQAARRWLLLRSALSGGSIGAAAASVLVLLVHWPVDVAPAQPLWDVLYSGPWRGTSETVVALLVLGAGFVAGALAGAAFALGRRLSDETLALAFDRKLNGQQAMVGAVDPTVAAHLRRHLADVAAAELRAARPAVLRPRLLQRWHGLLPLSLLLAVLTNHLPKAQLPPSSSTGTKVVQLDDLDELDVMTALESSVGIDDKDRRRLRDISEQSQRLREKLARGVSQREALADIARLQATLTEATLELDEGNARAGLQAAVAVLSEAPETLRAATALRGSDFQQLDEEMRRLSSAEERRSRQRAHDVVHQAERAAREAGAPSLSTVLSTYERWLAAPSDELQGELRTPSSDPTPEAPSRDERHRAPAGERDRDPGRARESAPPLERSSTAGQAPQTQPGLQRGFAQFDTERRARDAARFAAERPEQGQASHLRSSSTPSQAARREQALRRASRALRRLQNTLAERSLPLPTTTPGPEAPGQQEPREGAAPSAGNRDGVAEHDGTATTLDTPSVVAKTAQQLDLRHGQLQRSLGRGSGDGVPRVMLPTPSSLDAVGPEQVQSVDRASIPTEYREQVSRYFSSE